MTRQLLFDTDVLVDYLRGYPQAVQYVESRREMLLTSAIVVAELFVGVRDDTERAALDALLSVFDVIPIDAGLAERGGTLRRAYGRSHGTGLADALIAATSLREGANLITLNDKHFPMLHTITVPYRKT